MKPRSSDVRLAALVWLALCVAGPAPAQTLEPIRYSVSVEPLAHYLQVEATIPTDGLDQIDLMMPVWTPGSYLVREYSRNVESLTAAADSGGGLLPIQKTRKNRWRVSAPPGARAIVLRYRVYAHELSVRTNWVDEELALINGAATFLTRLDAPQRPYEVRLVRPPEWGRSLSPMASPAQDVYRADDFDALVDSPILAGNPAVYDFTVDGKPCRLADFSERGEFDGARAAPDLASIVRQTAAMWNGLPYERYSFFNILGAGRNGLEHRESTVLIAPRDSTKTRTAYLEWLGLAAHEHFHAWNVKRLRPAELGPFDYENEVYTRSLWVVEGVTDYYADLIVRRAGLSSDEEYLAALSGQIASLQTTPGRLVQPLESASYDAWIKYYRPDENSANASISYYTKGAVVAFLLDAEIRRRTAGERSLDDLMRLLYARFSGPRGYTPADVRSAVADLVGGSEGRALAGWLADALETASELDYGPALEWFGLEFMPPPEKPRVWLGLATRLQGQHVLVTEVRRGSPAAAAGLDIGDEIVAIDGVATDGLLAGVLAAHAPGDRLSVLIIRRGAPVAAEVTLAIEPGQLWQLGTRAGASAVQRAHLASWLGAR